MLRFARYLLQMPVESVTFISDLNASNPLGTGEPKSFGDDHMRNIKLGIKNTFPSISGAVTPTHTELNNLAGVTGKTGTGNVVLSASPTFTGTVTAGVVSATTLQGSGGGVTALNASNLASGTVPDARFPSTLPAAIGTALTALNASNLASGTVPDARFPATLPALNGSALTNLNGSNVATGTVADARLSSQVCLKDTAISGQDDGSASDPGYRGMPRVVASSVRAIAVSDLGKCIHVTANGGGAMTIADGSFPEGFIVTILAGGDTAFTVTNDGAMYLAGANFGTTGTRTIPRGGVATFWKIFTGNWLCWGNLT